MNTHPHARVCVHTHIYIYTYHNIVIYIYIVILKYIEYFFGGRGIYDGIMLDVGHWKKIGSWNISTLSGRSKTGSWNIYGLEGLKLLWGLRVVFTIPSKYSIYLDLPGLKQYSIYFLVLFDFCIFQNFSRHVSKTG